MADNPEKSVLIVNNIFLKTYRATERDYEQFKKDVAEQLRLGLKFDKASTPVSLNTAIETYKAIRDGLYLNKAQQVSLDYKNAEGKTETKPIYLTKDEYLKLKLLSAMDDQDKVIKVYQRLQDLILGNQFLLKEDRNSLNDDVFTFEMYRDRVLGLFDTLQGDVPSKMDQLMKGYQKSYEESMEILEDLITSNNPLRSGYYRMYNQNDEVRTTVDAFKRAVLEKAAIEANENSEFKQMQLGLMKLLQYGSLDERLRKQILLLIKQNAEGVATVTGGAEENYATELNKLLNQWRFTPQQIQKPIITTLGDALKQGWSNFADILKRKPTDVTQASPTPSASPIVTDDYLKQLEKDLSNIGEEVTKVIGVLNPALSEDQLKLKMYEELLINLEFLLDLIMDIKLASVNSDVQLKPLYENLKKALKNVMEETKSLNQSNQEIKELMTPIAKAMEGLTNLPEGGQVTTPVALSQPIVAPNQVAPEPALPEAEPPLPETAPQMTPEQINASMKLNNANETLNTFEDKIEFIKEMMTDKIPETEKSMVPETERSIGSLKQLLEESNKDYYENADYIQSQDKSGQIMTRIGALSPKVDQLIQMIVEPFKTQFASYEDTLKDAQANVKLQNTEMVQNLLGAIQKAKAYQANLDTFEFIQEFTNDVKQIEPYATAVKNALEAESMTQLVGEITTERPSPTLPPMTPIGRNTALSLPPLRSNPIAETEKSQKQMIQTKLSTLLKSKLPEFSTRLDPKFTVNELNSLVSGLSNREANLLRIAFVIANIQENVESKDRDMDGLTEAFFSKMISYFEKSRLSTAYYNILDSNTIQDEMKQIQIDLYCMLVDQLYALHQTTGAVYTYAANTERRNFKSIDSRGIDLILLDTILPKFNKDEVYMPSYLGAVQTYETLDIYLRDLGDVLPTFDGMLQSNFTTLKKMDNNTNRRNFLTECIHYLVNKKYRDPGEAKQILYKLLFGRDSWGSYAERMSWGGDDINLSDEIKDMDGGANAPAQPIQLDKLKEAIQKLDEYRKTLRSTQEELNSWKEKYATYNKSVDITKNFKGDKVIDSETIQMIKLFVEDLESAYNNVREIRIEQNELLAESEVERERARDEALTAAKPTPPGTSEIETKERQSASAEAAARAARAAARDETVKTEADRKILTAEKTFTEQLKAFLETKFAYTDANAGKVMEMFVSSLRKALPGELKGVSNDINGLSKQLLSIQNLMMKLTENTKESNYYIDSEIVSIFEFLKGKAADLKKFNTERFNAMDKTIRSIYEFILTTNKPLESKEKFKLKRLEFEALLDGAENVADEQRFKDLIIDPKKKNVKGLIPTIKDIKRLLETDIDYFTSLFQQKATSILKEQELRRQQEELQVRRAQPGPFAALFGQQPGMKVPGGSQSGGADIDKDNRIKLDYYFGIKKQEAGKEEEEYKQYKDVQLYLDAFNKLIDSYKFSLTTVTDPAAALALSGDKSLFNMIYDKYVKSSEDENKGEFIASQELATSLETNNLIPRNVLRVSMRDRIIILFTTLFMRLITLSIVEFMIEKGVLKNLKYTLLAYLGFFSILFIAFTGLVNLDMYRLRIVFNYLNFHANSDKVYSYLILLWTFGAIIYYIITNVNQDINVTNTSEDVKARLIYRIQVVSLIVWLFLTIMVFIF
jgi:flagellar basal body rod protein FlgC